MTKATRRVLFVVPLWAASSLGACASWAPTRIAGSIPMPAGSVRTLELQAPETKDLRLELWNRGPGKVTFRRILPTRDETAHGVLEPGEAEFRWSATTDAITVELTADAAGATVAYAIASRGSLSAEVHQP